MTPTCAPEMPIVKFNTILPFRVKFTAIGLGEGGTPGIPGIGVQVIGVSNYIL